MSIKGRRPVDFSTGLMKKVWEQGGEPCATICFIITL